ncbi:hypothetical protein CDAR_17461 [Caerostris darwini]|uniref:Uncharacterized protein n=1 Tax=Caerostris darwini TaxID=1538125 RepID=A0AAV4VFK8_9ARAC|nr:hypothetical protein CDAR_17461 [Caerostris darwini]
MRPQQRARTQSANNGARQYATWLAHLSCRGTTHNNGWEAPGKVFDTVVVPKVITPDSWLPNGMDRTQLWKHYKQSLSSTQNDPNKLIFRIASASSSNKHLPIAKLIRESPITR